MTPWHVTKVKGCAGAGKSYTTRKLLFDAFADENVEPWGSCIASFTRAAMQDEEFVEAVTGFSHRHDLTASWLDSVVLSQLHDVVDVDT